MKNFLSFSLNFVCFIAYIDEKGQKKIDQKYFSRAANKQLITDYVFSKYQINSFSFQNKKKKIFHTIAHSISVQNKYVQTKNQRL